VEGTLELDPFSGHLLSAPGVNVSKIAE
jgi:hypothetical protein